MKKERRKYSVRQMTGVPALTRPCEKLTGYEIGGPTSRPALPGGGAGPPGGDPTKNAFDRVIAPGMGAYHREARGVGYF